MVVLETAIYTLHKNVGTSFLLEKTIVLAIVSLFMQNQTTIYLLPTHDMAQLVCYSENGMPAAANRCS
jgi:hypothetical protein